jgi:hypothetical protein
MSFGKSNDFFDFLLLTVMNESNSFLLIMEGEYTMAAAKPMTLQDRILQIDHIQARRYSKLGGVTLEIASEGIIRHLRACARMDVNPDASAVREIIDDALNGRRVFAETSNDLLAA